MSWPGPESRRQLRAVGRVAAVGVEVTALTCAGAAGGYWADGAFETSPYLTLGGVFLGSLFGLKRLLSLKNVLNPDHVLNRDDPPDVGA
ncbi:MAG: AtpZ/AtpI family protein [Proteobacteria bacterium]|nr:AtpZ/AtpI family protein [Pseudomonadota bacterium]